MGAAYWLDGGWGADALLGEQSRPHGDADLVVHRAQLGRVQAVLHERGYAVLRDWLPMAIAFRDGDGREVDLHPVDPTPDGGGDQVLTTSRPPSSWHYGPPVTGAVGGRPVRCCSAVEQLAMREGYEPRAVDRPTYNFSRRGSACPSRTGRTDPSRRTGGTRSASSGVREVPGRRAPAYRNRPVGELRRT